MKHRNPKTRDAYQLGFDGKTIPQRIIERLELSIANNGKRPIKSLSINEKLSKLHYEKEAN